MQTRTKEQTLQGLILWALFLVCAVVGDLMALGTRVQRTRGAEAFMEKWFSVVLWGMLQPV